MSFANLRYKRLYRLLHYLGAYSLMRYPSGELRMQSTDTVCT
jgi:hypothetical protein